MRQSEKLSQINLKVGLKDLFDHALHDLHDLILIHEGCLNVDLCEFRLSVSPKIFITKTFGNLIIAIHSGSHQDLLKELGRLRQSKKSTRMGPARNQIISGTLWRSLRQQRCLNI